MKKMLKVWSLCLILLVVLAGNVLALDTEWIARTGVQDNKVWFIKYTEPVAAASVTNKNIFVLDSSKQPKGVTTSLSVDGLTVQVAPDEKYTPGATYTLHILNTVTPVKTTVKSSKNNIKMKFAIVASGEATATTTLFGLVRQISAVDGSVYVDVAGKGLNLKYDYNETWDGYAPTSLVMFDGTGNVKAIPTGSLIADQLWSYSGAGIKCVNRTGTITLDSALIIAKISALNGTYIGSGQLSDMTTAANAGSNIRALLDPTTQKVKVLVIEQ